ncbi:MerR family transcriptional regulator [Salana multivorans]
MAATGADEPGDVTEHLTVAAVAARLGVAASTLRTWDRRYGLGPSGRSAGRHRRYSPDDLARLETMRALTQRGVALADAARIAVRSAPRDEVEEDLDPLSLAAAAVDARMERLVRSLHTAAAQLGLTEVLTQRVHPAREILADATRADAPGRDPEAALTAALLTVIRERVQRAPVPRLGPVLVVGARSQLLDAHVLAAMLHEAGVRTRVSPFHPAEARRRRGRPEQTLRGDGPRHRGAPGPSGPPETTSAREWVRRSGRCRRSIERAAVRDPRGAPGRRRGAARRGRVPRPDAGGSGARGARPRASPPRRRADIVVVTAVVLTTTTPRTRVVLMTKAPPAVVATTMAR